MSNKENSKPIDTSLKKSKRSINKSQTSVLSSSVGNVSTNTTSSMHSDNLNDKFTNYIDYVKQLEEIKEKLTKENASIHESKIEEINKLKQTYNDEIAALRTALDDLAAEKVSLGYENKNLYVDLENWRSKLNQKSEYLTQLQRKYDSLEDQHLRVKRRLQNFETNHDEIENNEFKINKLNEELKNEILARNKLENRLETLMEENEFYKKLNTAENKVSCNEVINTSTERNKELEDKWEELKDSMMEEFQDRAESMQEEFETKIKELNSFNENLFEKNKMLTIECRKNKSMNETLVKQLNEKENKICELNAIMSKHINEISDINKEYEDKLKMIIDENENLQNNLHKKMIEINDLIREKAELEKQLYMFTSLLEGEQSRCNLETNSSGKKRKVFELNHDYVIVANSNGKIRIGCEDNYSGNYFFIINDTNEEINLNEWKISIVNSCGVELQEYSFPPMIINPGERLNVWSQNQDIEENNENFKLNIELPHDMEFLCSLINDTNMMEANFELKKYRRSKRQKLSNSNRKESCLLM